METTGNKSHKYSCSLICNPLKPLFLIAYTFLRYCIPGVFDFPTTPSVKIVVIMDHNKGLMV